MGALDTGGGERILAHRRVMRMASISAALAAPDGTLVHGVVSDWPRGDHSMAEITHIRVTCEYIGRPQVAIDHAAWVRQVRLREDGGTRFDAGQAELGHHRREHGEHGPQKCPVTPVVGDDPCTPVGLSPCRRRARLPACTYLALTT